MVYHLLMIVMLTTGPEYSISGPLTSVEDCRDRAEVILQAYPSGAVRGVKGHCIPGHTA